MHTDEKNATGWKYHTVHDLQRIISPSEFFTNSSKIFEKQINAIADLKSALYAVESAVNMVKRKVFSFCFLETPSIGPLSYI